jgi:hypothetical protein
MKGQNPERLTAQWIWEQPPKTPAIDHRETDDACRIGWDIAMSAAGSKREAANLNGA